MADSLDADPDEIAAEMDERSEEWLEILSTLIRTPSENPPGDTREIASYLTGLLDERGIDYEVVAPKERMPNVVAQFEGERGDGPHLAFNGHLDTFPRGEEGRWDRDPFSGAVEDGKVHGRGAADMHGGFTASLAAFVYLFERRDEFGGTVTLSATSDEETGSEWGAKYLLEEYPEYRGDAVINGEPSCNDLIYFGERGAIWFDVTVLGASDHSAYPGGLNAIDALYEYVADLRSEVKGMVDIPEGIRRAVLEAGENLDAYQEGLTEHVLDAQVNLDSVDARNEVNLTPERAEGKVDVRLPLALSGADVIERMHDLAGRSPAEIEIDVFHHTDPTHSDLDHPIFEHVQSAAAGLRGGDEPLFTCCAAMTDARFFRMHGVPAVCYGPTKHNMGHQNEYIHVEDFMDVVKAQTIAAAEFVTAGD